MPAAARIVGILEPIGLAWRLLSLEWDKTCNTEARQRMPQGPRNGRTIMQDRTLRSYPICTRQDARYNTRFGVDLV
jgi:hypothetical protein